MKKRTTPSSSISTSFFRLKSGAFALPGKKNRFCRRRAPVRNREKNLESAAVGHQRAAPVREFMKTAGLGDDFMPRAEKKMIGINH